MTEQLKETCLRCGHVGEAAVEVQTSGVHHAKMFCRQCGRFIRWLAKPDDSPTKYRRPAPHRKLVKKYSRGFCELCLIREEEIPAGEELEGHHVIEYQDGGEPTRENTWILCTACARLIHWRRTYVGHLLEMARSMKRWQN